MTDSQYREDLKVMIQADQGHLAKAETQGDTHAAKGFRNAISNSRLELEKLNRRR